MEKSKNTEWQAQRIIDMLQAEGLTREEMLKVIRLAQEKLSQRIDWAEIRRKTIAAREGYERS